MLEARPSLEINLMKKSILLCALLACAAPICAQPADTAPKLINDLPFPLLAPEKAQELAFEKPIVLRLNNVTLGAALDELQRQSGVELNTSPDVYGETLAKTLSIDLQTLSFDQAFNAIVDKAGVKASLQRWDQNQPWRVDFDQEDDSRNAPQSGAGLFVVRLWSLASTTSKTVNLGDPKAPERSQRQDLAASLVLLPDLRLPVIGSPQTRVTRAEDEQGRSLLPQLSEGEIFSQKPHAYGFYSSSYWDQSQANVRLLAPAPDAKTLAHLEGQVVYAIVSKREKWEIADLLSAPEWTHSFAGAAGEIKLKLKATSTPEGNLKLEIEASSSGPAPEDQVRQPLMSNQPLIENIRIEDAGGTIFRSSGYSFSESDNTVITRATFVPVGKDDQDATTTLNGPLKFVLDAPVEVVQTQVPFSFENVPLP